ncbi:MAG: hypothetical protein JSU03_06180 [Bacteroidetes bacterium]|nr:hypothetical protein [Bacteroidota bacterium]MBS1756849.1 hypothetical protein [Bacteroidota bacterium]
MMTVVYASLCGLRRAREICDSDSSATVNGYSINEKNGISKIIADWIVLTIIQKIYY